MTVYNINLGIGWASSGVEYAQAYRAKIFSQIDQKAKFIFTDMILADNIQHLTQNIGFSDDQVIWLYNYFTDMKLAETSVTLDEVLAQVDGQHDRTERNGKVVRYFYTSEDKFITCYLKDEEGDCVERVEHVFAGKLIRKDYFSYKRYCTEFFAPRDNVAQLYQRTFYNEDGRAAYDMIMSDSTEEIYRFPDRVLYGKQELLRYFMKSLRLTKEDMVILDRETGIGQVIFEEAQAAHLGVVVHAEHYSENATDQDYILWNNYYDYQFTNADKVDFFIVATDRQKHVLEEQFQRYTPHRPRIVTIPVGSLPELVVPKQPRKPFSMMTASRLAQEKHIDWLVKSVIEARKSLPELTFDIYGSGGTEGKIREIITEAQAEGYIRLMGHADLAEIYAQYEVYLTASTSEGFGLTLMEAVGSGLPMIGFDVPYGNQTFIADGQNGYLLAASADHVEEEITKAFSKAIIQLYTEGDRQAMSQHSYELAQHFLTSQVEQAWQQLIQEVVHDSIS